MNQRLVASLLFGASAAVNGLVVWLVAGGGELWSLAVSLYVALTVGLALLAAPRLAADARRRPSRWRGFWSGALLTFTSIAAAHVATTSLMFLEGPGGVLSAVSGALLTAVTTLIVVLMTGSPLLIVGGTAGLAFYDAVRSGPQGAV